MLSASSAPPTTICTKSMPCMKRCTLDTNQLNMKKTPERASTLMSGIVFISCMKVRATTPEVIGMNLPGGGSGAAEKKFMVRALPPPCQNVHSHSQKSSL